jgi:DNA polymerase-3 subunit alpha
LADKFVHIHCHSNRSLLDGLSRPEEIVDYTLEIGQPASVITDHGNMYSIVDHFQYAKAQGQKAIAGFEAYVVKDHLIKDKSERKKVEDLTLDIYAKLLEALSNGGIVQK